ncbi:hypothetical protein [Streptomyces sp. NPDC002088]|uniref:hypothetical protein n=1 Tax=Streptomyces sp. NPDC002088 TaxID=3154665 RepID=UPI00331887B2
MLALRLTLVAHAAVQLRRLLVAAASAGTGFLLLCTLGYAMSHPGTPATSLLLRLAWCAVPLAATVYLAVAVARTDPATKPRPGLSAIGLGPARLMAISATTTALSCTLGSMLALLVFLHLRGDLRGMPFDGAAVEFLAADAPLPLPAALTLLALLPTIASTATALALRPKGHRPLPTRTSPRGYGRFGAYGYASARETFGAYGRFGARLRASAAGAGAGPDTGVPRKNGTPSAPGRATAPSAAADGAPQTPDHALVRDLDPHRTTDHALAPDADPDPHRTTDHASDPDSDPHRPPAPRPAPSALPWGVAVLAAGLAVEAYASRSTAATGPELPTDLATGPAGILVGWLLTALGLALAGPGLTHFCGLLLQAARPGALRLLAGRVLMDEASRIGRPLGVVCAVLSAMYATTPLYDPNGPSFAPLTTLGALLVVGCTVATLLTAAVEARQARSDTTAALVRLGAPATMLRGAAAVRAGALLALFAPLTLIVAELAALPLSHR